MRSASLEYACQFLSKSSALTTVLLLSQEFLLWKAAGTIDEVGGVRRVRECYVRS